MACEQDASAPTSSSPLSARKAVVMHVATTGHDFMLTTMQLRAAATGHQFDDCQQCICMRAPAGLAACQSSRLFVG